jgi:hypothetical protein
MAADTTEWKIKKLIQDLKDQYSKTVRNNPDTVAQIESAVRILSFLVAGILNMFLKLVLSRLLLV